MILLAVMVACGGGGGGGGDDDGVDAPAAVRWPTGAIKRSGTSERRYVVAFDDRGRQTLDRTEDGIEVRTWRFEGDFLAEHTDIRGGGVYDDLDVTFVDGLPRTATRAERVAGGFVERSTETWDWDTSTTPPSLRTIDVMVTSPSDSHYLRNYSLTSDGFQIARCAPTGGSCSIRRFHGELTYLGGPSWWTQAEILANFGENFPIGRRTFDSNRQLLSWDHEDDVFPFTVETWTRKPEGPPLTLTIEVDGGDTTTIEYTFD